MRKKQHGFTLVELMIAVALMVILTGSIVFVFTQAQRVYTQTDATVKVYQNARTAMDIMERDIANAYRTMEMEFWSDDKDSVTKLYNGHLDENDEGYQLTLNPNWKNVPKTPTDFQKIEDYRMLTGVTSNYIFSMMTEQNQYPDYKIAGITHWDDAFYFKTETAIPSLGGTTRTALVRYGLHKDPAKRRNPILMKWVTWLDKTDPENPKAYAEAPQPLCYFVTDFRVEVYIRNKRTSNPGDYYIIAPDTSYPSSDIKANFDAPIRSTPITAGSRNLFMPLFMHIRGGGSTQNSKILRLGGGFSGYSNMPEGKFVRVLSGEPYFTLSSNQNASNFFYQLDKGDKIFLYDSDTNATRTMYLIPPGEYTIKDIRNENNEWRIYFREAIDTTQLDKENRPFTAMSYRASWVPSAVKITLKITSSKVSNPNQGSRTIVRIFKILGG